MTHSNPTTRPALGALAICGQIVLAALLPVAGVTASGSYALAAHAAQAPAAVRYAAATTTPRG